MEEEKKKDWVMKYGDAFRHGVRVLEAIIILFGIFYGLQWYLEKQILNDPGFITKLSHKIRPALLFDEEGIIVRDMGAKEYVINIKVVVKADPKKARMKIITVYLNKYLDLPPILEPLYGDFVQTPAKRGKENTWIYQVGEIDTLTWGSSVELTEKEKPHFRLEIIAPIN